MYEMFIMAATLIIIFISYKVGKEAEREDAFRRGPKDLNPQHRKKK